jgi:hypothetical protein
MGQTNDPVSVFGRVHAAAFREAERMSVVATPVPEILSRIRFASGSETTGAGRINGRVARSCRI